MEEKSEGAVQPKEAIISGLHHAFNLKDTPGIFILVKITEIP